MANIDNWSTNPANNTLVGSINWSEGMLPGDVNGSGRQMMADVASWRDFLYNAGTSPFALLSGATFTSGIFAPAFALNASSFFGSSGSDPVLVFDGGDNLLYSKALNQLNFSIASVNKFSVSSTLATYTVPITAPTFRFDATGYLTVSAGELQLVGDTNDFIRLNRSTSQWDVVINGNSELNVRGGGIVVAGGVTAAGTGVFGGPVTSGGNQLGTREILSTAVPTSPYNLGLGNLGGMVIANSGTISIGIPADGTVAWPTGSTIVLINNTGTTVSVSPAGGVTLVWAGVGSIGGRTLALAAMVTLLKISPNQWYISGAGLS